MACPPDLKQPLIRTDVAQISAASVVSAPLDNVSMELRPELCAPVVSLRRVAELRSAIDSIENLLFCGESADVAIDAFNAETGHDYTVEDFRCFGELCDAEELALEAARPVWPKVANITREELIEIVRRIIEGDVRDQRYYLRILEANVVHPAACDLIFHPPSEPVDASPERIVDALLSYRPCRHGGSWVRADRRA